MPTNSSSTSTLLIIGYVWPEPNSSAAGARMMQLIKSFQTSGYRVVYASPADPSDHAVDLKTIAVEPLSIALNCSSFNEQVKAIQPDVVMFDRFMMEEQFGWRVSQEFPAALRILDMEDLHSLRHARHQAIKNERCDDALDLNSELALREVASIYRCDVSLVISSYEYQLLRDRYQVPTSQLLLLPFMVPLAGASQGLSFEQRQHFVSIGNFRHAPNWDAVLQLRQLWPAIRQQCPGAELHIYGAYPPKKATQLDNPKLGFCIKGWANNVAAVMQHGRVLLAPLRFGAGLKGKLLDAMLYGLPSVTTPIGAEGMTTEAPWPGAITSNDQDFIEAAVELYNAQQRWQQTRLTIPAHLQQYDEQSLSNRLQQHVQAIRSDINSHRQRHFIGAMLLHHSMKSTQYMSQWIEEKNRTKT
ncbi:glycosyltransferase family 4 protein [Neiella marina]|uniref:Glycosyltransferase family 4 protein n=1 Tax=Neiella holothuriorum TaxID=2870530 RepID=A0ABS7EGM0_9GAMM|nr:glycosyltransferase [Neiella holothuriorum]MBW8191470.1 glycosyltransferase family 4 protein [Neiella holothuriorum]